MAKALEIRRGMRVSAGRPAEPAEWVEHRQRRGLPGPGPELSAVRIPDHPGPTEDTSFGPEVEFHVGERR